MSVNVSCLVDHVYPRPHVTVHHGQGRHRVRLKGVRITHRVIIALWKLPLLKSIEAQITQDGTVMRSTMKARNV